mmetsp:Transcript_1926/g.4654  ORF Transcript_1926/g.4654 Transcript_1926/m.4654 type:complete len:388 (-) Transcript_1926:76-1239(-)
MLRRRVREDLPLGGARPSDEADGSGKSIKMEAPLAKAIRTADGFVKGSWIWLFVSVLLILGGWSIMRRSSASMVLDCNSNGCTLTVQTPKSWQSRSPPMLPFRRKTVIQFDKDQLVRSDNIKWNHSDQQIVENHGASSPTYNQPKDEDDDTSGGRSNKRNKKRNKKNKKKKKYKRTNNGGPDANGNYDSYIIILREPLPDIQDEEDPNESPSKKMQRKMAAQHNRMENDPNSLASQLAPFAVTNDLSRTDAATSDTEYILHLRDFNVGMTRRLARTSVTKINAYTKGRRLNCTIRESRPVKWQGLVMLILGIFSLVLCLLLGEFVEEYDPSKHGSYRSRMAEMRRREEAKRAKLKRSYGRAAATRRRPSKLSTSTDRSSAYGGYNRY